MVFLEPQFLWLLLLTGLGGGAYAWRRDRSAPNPSGPAEWPPLTSTATSPTAAPSTSTIARSAAAPSNQTGSSTIQPMAASSGDWVPPLDDGSCPLSHPVKANDNSGIFHVPEGRFYARTKAERCYVDASAAAADGYRQAKN